MNASVGWPHSFIRGVVQAALGALLSLAPGLAFMLLSYSDQLAVVDYSEPSIWEGWLGSARSSAGS